MGESLLLIKRVINFIHKSTHSIYSFIHSPLHRSALCPLYTQSQSIPSSIALPYAHSTRCPTVFNPPSLCPVPSPHAVPQYSPLHRSALCPVHTLSHSIHPSIALPYTHSKRCPTVFPPPSLCPMPTPHSVPQPVLHTVRSTAYSYPKYGT
jgi:hypothetical protein